MMKIVECVWKEQFIEKLERKHNVSAYEVEEVLLSNPHFDFVAKGHVTGENVYWALGQTEAGRYLTILILHLQAGRAGNADLRSRYEYQGTEAL